MAPRAYSYLRMSTETQLKGDSRRRQLEASRAYAAEKGLELAEEDQLEDIGISAFKGANVKDGVLGQFLAAAEGGKVPAGSYLLVESLDRITRQKLHAGLALYLRIINAGVNVVTLADGHVHRAEGIELADLITSLVTMSRAHEESVMKSDRIGKAWKNKRERAKTGQPMTKWAPAWLRLSPDREGFEPIPDRVELVRAIFNDAASGIGMYRIAARLNELKIPTFTPSKGWHQSYISKILSNRAVLGEFQPHRREERKHLPDGDPILNYFPAIIDHELFFRAQNGKEQRRVGSAGRKGPAFANLFGGLATCLYCGEPMKFENKGVGAKGGTYLICDGAKRRLGCVATRWKYTDFEASFLTFVREIDLKSILASSEEDRVRSRLMAELASIDGELVAINRQMEQTYELLNNARRELSFVSHKLSELADKQAALEGLREAKKREKIEIDARGELFATSREEIEALVCRLQEMSSADVYPLRAQIASRLRALIASLRVAPLGNMTPIDPNLTFEGLRSLTREQAAEVVSHMAELGGGGHRYFIVTFANAATRIIYPNDHDPLRYEIQVMMQNDTSFSVDRPASTLTEVER